jgi:plasmid stabilization system protein ParE
MGYYPIIWSPVAKSSYYNILEYLEHHWTVKEIEVFFNRTEEVLEHISINPLLFPYSKEGGIHKCVLVKQVSLFYRIKANNVELLLFWDTRQDPAKLVL